MQSLIALGVTVLSDTAIRGKDMDEAKAAKALGAKLLLDTLIEDLQRPARSRARC